MKEMIQRVREERGGFTLAELLIVVAIIAVLVALAIPVFTGAMDKANLAVAQGDIRSVKAEAVTYHLLNSPSTTTDTYYEAKIDTEGNVTAFGPSTATKETEAKDLKDKVGKEEVTVVVKVSNKDLTPTAGSGTQG